MKITSIEKLKKVFNDWSIGPYPFELKKTEVQDHRNLDQNALLWLWCTFLQEQNIGYTKSEFYSIFIEKFAPREYIYFKNEIINSIVTSSKMTKKQMANFLTNIQRFSQVDLGIELPNPNDLKFEQFYEAYKHLI